MDEEFRKMLSDMVGYPVDISFKQIFEKDGIAHSDVIALMQYKQLARIADALEEISSRLDDITASLDELNNNLNRCIFTDGREDFLHIAGIIETN